MAIRGCIIMSPEDAEQYIGFHGEGLPASVIQKYPFIRIQSIKDIYDHCKTQLEYIRRFVSKDRYAYMVELKGLTYIGLNLVKVEEFAWLKPCDDFKVELGYINGDAE